jgi:hypothetical protein
VVRAASTRFWISLAFLNSLLVLRVPRRIQWWTFVLPSLDAVTLSLVFILLRAWGIDALVIILGDHQPHSDITRRAPSPGVPAHVLSRNSAFIALFLARGYTPGMAVDEALPHPGLGSLLPDLVADFWLGAAGSVH